MFNEELKKKKVIGEFRNFLSFEPHPVNKWQSGSNPV